MFLNPFFLYALTWISVVLFYNLEISALYPKLSNELLNFIIITIFITVILSLFYKNKFEKYNFLNKIEKKYKHAYMLIYLFFILEFFIEGRVPLIAILSQTGYYYASFKGIKTFHVIIATYNFYITLCAFNDYQYNKKIKYLFYSVLGIIPYILLYSRGSILLLCMCLFFIWLFYKYNLKTIIKIGFLGIIFLYVFGISGNIRHYYNWNDTRMIKNIAKINTEKNNLDPLIWSYVYITSPLGNLQYNLDNSKPKYKVQSFIYENLLVDAISKRLDYQKSKPKLMTQELNVCTVYTGAYLSYGKLGMFLTFFIYMSCELIYLLILRGSKYWIIGVALINILNIFSIFSNMFIFSGLSFCLVYPLIDIFKDKIKNIRRRN